MSQAVQFIIAGAYLRVVVRGRNVNPHPLMYSTVKVKSYSGNGGKMEAHGKNEQVELNVHETPPRAKYSPGRWKHARMQLEHWDSSSSLSLMVKIFITWMETETVCEYMVEPTREAKTHFHCVGTEKHNTTEKCWLSCLEESFKLRKKLTSTHYAII